LLVARLHAARDLALADEPIPVPRPGEVLVRVDAVGLCGSDTHWWETGGIGDTRLPRPLVLGHEIVGTIQDGAGRSIPVAIDPSQPCHACPTCQAGRDDLCPTTRFAGYAGTDGGLRDWMAWPRDLCVPIPAGLDPADACQLEALGVALCAVDRADIRPGTRVAVVGAGPIGQLVIRACVARGATDIVATDRLAHRVDAARASGAAVAIQTDGAPPDVAPVDVAIECAGTDDGVGAALELVCPGGHVVLVGIPDDDRTTFRASLARRKGVTISLSRRMRATDLVDAVAQVADGRISLDGLVSHRFDLADAPAAFAAQASRDGLKVVVRPQHAIV